jgi:REP element-mobilizing transposase RayT
VPKLGEVMRAFKSLSSLAVNRISGRTGALWQRNYFERVVRDERHLAVIRQYIADNPRRWDIDRENPNAPSD